MKAIAFDTHAYVKKLTAVGCPEEQAEVQAEALADLVDERLVTKDYLDIRIEEIRRDMKELELSLTVRMGAMTAATIAILAALIKL